jgi:hypothetical protein
VFILSYFMGHEKFFKKQTKLGFTAQDILWTNSSVRTAYDGQS